MRVLVCNNNVFSAEMIKDVGLNWVILGHSERRVIFHESSEVWMLLYGRLTYAYIVDSKKDSTRFRSWAERDIVCW